MNDMVLLKQGVARNTLCSYSNLAGRWGIVLEVRSVGRVTGRKHFIRTLIGQFPEVAARIGSTARGLLHCEMGYFAEATQEAIERGDEMAVRRHFAYAEELMRHAGPALENALQVSYLEYINFDKEYRNRLQPRAILPPLLCQSLADLEEHLRIINEYLRCKRGQEGQ
jgi:hypothetical protein